MKKRRDLRISSVCALVIGSLVTSPVFAVSPPPAPSKSAPANEDARPDTDTPESEKSATKPASDDTDKARLRFQRGVELYESGDVQAAYIEFKRAYALVPSYQLLFNIAQAQAELKDYVGALDSLRQYLEEGNEEISVERRVAVHKEIKRLKTYIAYVTLNLSVKDATIKVDGVIVRPGSNGNAIAVSAGRRKIEVLHKGYVPWERQVDVAGEDELSLDVLLVARPTSAPQPKVTLGAPSQSREVAPPPKRFGPMFWSGVAATAVFGTSSAIFGGLALRARNQHRDTLGTAPTTQEAIDDSASDVKRLALVTDISLALTVGAAAFTVGVVVWNAKKNRAREPKRLKAALAPTGVWLQGSF